MNHLSQWFYEQLQVSANGFVWGTEQVPEARRYVQPPKRLGEWTVARHVFHLYHYEQTIALPSMRQWMGGTIPSVEDSEEDIAWSNTQDRVERLLEKFRAVRAEQIELLPKFEDAVWNETRDAVWGTCDLVVGGQ